VVFYFLDKDLKVRNSLTGIKRIKGSHISENIIKTVIPIIKIIISNNRLGFFIGNNNNKNNIIIRAILIYLRSDLKDSNFKRIKYLDYIINLAVKAFLFRKNANAFKEEFKTKKNHRSSRRYASSSGKKN
jgi:hypothetical protein